MQASQEGRGQDALTQQGADPAADLSDMLPVISEGGSKQSSTSQFVESGWLADDSFIHTATQHGTDEQWVLGCCRLGRGGREAMTGGQPEALHHGTPTA